MLGKSLRFLLVASVPLALALAGFGTTACGGCYADGDSTDVRVEPATACLTVSPGHSENGCGSPGPTGVRVTNGCAEPLVIGATTVPPGKEAAFQASPAGAGRRSVTGTLGAKAITISWLDAADEASRKADAAPGG